MNKAFIDPLMGNLERIHRGKVRDTYAIPGISDCLLVSASDRVSTHNIEHESIVPFKGEVLNALTIFWMSHNLGVDTHLIAYGDKIYNYLPGLGYPPNLHLRAIIVRKLEMIPVEFIFRNRMAGSLWKDYYSKGLPNPYGINIEQGFKLMSPFKDIIFTPTDKSETDDPLLASAVVRRYPEAYRLARYVYKAGCEFALSKGIEIIDGKFEIGIDPNTDSFVLGDECLTPDSCRFVDASEISVGENPHWLDKQYLRDEAESVWGKEKKVPLSFSGPALAETSLRYRTIFQNLTGYSLDSFQKKHM